MSLLHLIMGEAVPKWTFRLGSLFAIPISMKLVNREWRSENFYSCPDSFFSELLESIKSSQKSICFTFYILEEGELASSIVSELLMAKLRGVHIRIIVDGFGTGLSNNNLLEYLAQGGIEIAISNPISNTIKKWWSFFQQLKRLNHRNHKKIAIFDEEFAIVGGINISDTEMKWEDFAIKISGENVGVLSQIFSKDWEKAFLLDCNGTLKFDESRFRKLKISLLHWKNRAMRGPSERRLFSKLLLSSKRIWLTTGYLVPPKKLLRLLKVCATQGADVRLIISESSDSRFLSLVGSYYTKHLIRSGVKVYSYPKKFIHAKCTLLDDRAIVGSSNLNHRSYFLDEELDILVKKKETCREVESKLRDLISHSELVCSSNTKLNLLKSCLTQFLLIFKGWL